MMPGVRYAVIPARAATDRTLQPRDLQVLCLLGRHVDDYGWCRRSQVKMAEELDCAHSTVRAAVKRLSEAGYLEIHRHETDNGRDSAHSYRVILDPAHPAIESVADVDEAVRKPVDEMGKSRAETPGDTPPPLAIHRQGVAALDRQGVAAHGSPPINDPSLTTPLNDRERGRERDGDRKEIERWLKRHHRDWPTFVSDSAPRALAAAMALSEAEREAAAARMGDYLAEAKAGGRKTVCSFAVYLDEKRWEKLPEPNAVDLRAPVAAKPFGPDWGAARIALLIAGPSGPSPVLTAFEKRMAEAGEPRRGSDARREAGAQRLAGGEPAARCGGAALGRDGLAGPSGAARADGARAGGNAGVCGLEGAARTEGLAVDPRSGGAAGRVFPRRRAADAGRFRRAGGGRQSRGPGGGNGSGQKRGQAMLSGRALFGNGDLPTRAEQDAWLSGRGGWAAAASPMERLAVDYDGGHEWFAVRSNPRCEDRAMTSLGERGFRTYAPRGRKVVIHRRTKKRIEREFKLLPGYVFVAMPRDRARQHFGLVRECDGVKDLVRIDGAPAAFPAAEIEKLQRTEELGLLALSSLVRKRGHDFRVGETVRIAGGPLAGFAAEVVDVSSRKSIRLLMEILGRATEIEYPVDGPIERT
ncbi:transcription termination/antitermination NusG family protein [Jiella pelagia]|uniref:Uncharacterized protein n=1 Tax=Jiella pelagia TaxID=2986949 RepID=A0ABY7BU05_9HYPH|nr:transcription termination/antitermination NusG family protein [Jiella pelagia]WAP67216.1 hypothetical protein OH818_16700 [Jiella pelagia]